MADILFSCNIKNKKISLKKNKNKQFPSWKSLDPAQLREGKCFIIGKRLAVRNNISTIILQYSISVRAMQAANYFKNQVINKGSVNATWTSVNATWTEIVKWFFNISGFSR